MNPQLPPFEDPSLQRALRDLAGNHTASASLRARVAQRMSAEPVADAPLKIGSKPSHPLKRLLAMAATIVVGVGVTLAAYEWYVISGRAKLAAYTQPKQPAAPSLWATMVDLHECGIDGGARQQALTVATATDPDAAAAEASTKLGRRVPKPAFAGTQWKLDASSFGDIGVFSGVRFHLTDGARKITVVSLPEIAWAYRKADTYTTTVDSHEIAGYVKDGGLHCVIGDRNMPLADVQALADQLRAQ